MKKFPLLIAITMVCCLLFTACKPGSKNINSSSDESNIQSGDSTSISEDYSAAISDETQSNLISTESGLLSTIGGSTATSGVKVDNTDYSGTSVKFQDLGSMEFDVFPDDYLYDWGFSVIKEGNIYKMWWVRPSLYDAIFYAESTDMKHWSNVQRVITISTPVKKEFKWLKWMLGRPSVLKVNDTYFMYFEGPATHELINGSSSETDNNVFVATSKNGINWTFYPDNNNPTPVVQEPIELMDKRDYGVGQPSAVYKDGTFYLYYCYVLAGKNQLMVATSKDGINFGDPKTHTNLGMVNGLGVKYNDVTKKFMMIFPYSIGGKPADYYIMESTDPLKWPYNTTQEAAKPAVKVTNNQSYQYAFADFVTNGQGHITTETFYITYMQGKISTTSDWRSEYRTWDGHITAVNPKEYNKKTMVLPNGESSSTATLAKYKDAVTTLAKMSSTAKYTAVAPSIDASMEAMWNNTVELSVKRGVYDWGSNITKTNATVRVMWNEDYLFTYAYVKDSKVSYSYKTAFIEEMWHRDSFNIFIDVPNNETGKNVLWGVKQYIACVGANNQDFCIMDNRGMDIAEDFTGIRRRVKTVSDGYIVETQIPWYSYIKSEIKENKVIGFDLSINDDMGVGDREAQVQWNDHTGNAFRYTDVLGDLKLIK